MNDPAQAAVVNHFEAVIKQAYVEMYMNGGDAYTSRDGAHIISLTQALGSLKNTYFDFEENVPVDPSTHNGGAFTIQQSDGSFLTTFGATQMEAEDQGGAAADDYAVYHELGHVISYADVNAAYQSFYSAEHAQGISDSQINTDFAQSSASTLAEQTANYNAFHLTGLTDQPIIAPSQMGFGI